MKKVMMKLDGMTCPSCLTKIEKAVEETPGTDNIKVLFNAGKLKFVMDPLKLIQMKLKVPLKRWVTKLKVLRKRIFKNERRRKVSSRVKTE